MTEQLEEKKQILNNKFNIYDTYIIIYKLWEKVIRVRDNNTSPKKEAEDFINEIAKTRTINEIKTMTEEEFINMFMWHFDYKFEELKKRTDDMYYYIRYNMEKNDINGLYHILERYSKCLNID